MIKSNQEIRILERDRDDCLIIDNPTTTEYTYSAWLYSNGPNVNLTLKMKSSSGYITETIGVGTTTRMEWVKLEGTVNVPANIVSLNIQLKNMGQRPNTTGYTVWYDDVSIKKTSSEIVEEDNYYPFGLKHKGYNIAVNGGNDKAQKYKYQGQERQDELRLNWDSFKWRNYDYAIGRFMSIDPLAEKYAYQSPYNFAENKVVLYKELEGLEAVPSEVTAAGRVIADKIDSFFNWIDEGLSKAGEAISATLADDNFEGNGESSNYGGYDFRSEVSDDADAVLSNNQKRDSNGQDVEVVDATGAAVAGALSGGLSNNGTRNIKEVLEKFNDGVSLGDSIKTTLDMVGSTGEGDETTQKNTTITVPNSTLYTVPYGNSAYLQKTNNGTTQVTVPNNQDSIDSARTAAENSEKEKSRLVNESINNLSQ
ncbi:hypothetical protein GCM10007424_11490 [Flavobacterium suaedae]|uniref:RHS repeat-associated core domain-containing protein n=1 Tax=Flavobacterium suaedae TaxID=1767027 RepID=A0ABQ1JS11_9FLAO|nr:RHS repeat-associated core domain-containing protein [Flavobacterium suaedae]GGB73290.1 hypothetical protein GCM10007424_11490 [Flavobacterium suaedae]